MSRSMIAFLFLISYKDHPMEFVEFAVTNHSRLEMLQRVFGEIKKDKEKRSFRPVEEWKKLFDDQAMSHFYEQATEAQKRLWHRVCNEKQRSYFRWWFDCVDYIFRHFVFRTKRIRRADFAHPGFSAMITLFYQGEYELISCEMVGMNRMAIQFNPLAGPYGGFSPMVVLGEAFGFRAIKIETYDGVYHVI